MSIIDEAKRVLQIESQALAQFSDKLSDKEAEKNFVQAVELLADCKGKVILTGMGKSGQVARKISSTLSSTGTPSLFLHPAEGSHGDLGVISENDLVLAISYGGSSDELLSLLKFVARKSVPLIALTGNLKSELAQSSSVCIDVSVSEEACPLKLAPTSSSTLSLAVGDALAMCVLKENGFKEQDYAEFHPGGALGKKLLTRVSDVMHKGDALPLVVGETSMSEVLSIMTAKEVRGVAGVINTEGALVGAITDGDIRRSLERKEDLISLTAKDLMNITPKTIDANELAQKALFMMQEFKIQTLFCIDTSLSGPKKTIGLIHIQDLLKL